MVVIANSSTTRSRAIIIDLISRGFSYPVADFYADLTSGEFVFQLLEESNKSGLDEVLLDLIRDLESGIKQVISGRSRQELESEYIELFEHSQKLAPIHLYGGLYLTNDGNRIETLQSFISMYRDYGLEMEEGSENADHLIVVLEFLALLYKKCAELDEEGDEDAVHQLKADINKVKNRLAWTKSLESELETRDSHPLYLPLSRLLVKALALSDN